MDQEFINSLGCGKPKEPRKVDVLPICTICGKKFLGLPKDKTCYDCDPAGDKNAYKKRV